MYSESIESIEPQRKHRNEIVLSNDTLLPLAE